MENVRNFIKEKIGEKITVRTDMDKKKAREFSATVKEAYRSIFVIEVDENLDDGKLHTYMYSEVMSNIIEIKEFNSI